MTARSGVVTTAGTPRPSGSRRVEEQAQQGVAEQAHRPGRPRQDLPVEHVRERVAEPPGENAVRGHLVADQPRLSVPVR
jgi:hypothetical protein